MAATQTLRCERHGEPTRLTCVDCEQPICPKCMVRTEVGLRCEPCSRPAVATPAIGSEGSRRPLLLGLAGLAVIAVGVVVLVTSRSSDSPRSEPPLPPVGTWTDAPNLASIRGSTTAVVLKDGRVLVAGGGVGAIILPAAELYDAAANTWTATGELTEPRRGHQAVVLPDGRVLVAGGIFEGVPLASAELYDPGTGRWSPTAPMALPRLGHSLTLLADGRVLAAGGTALNAPAPGGSQVNPEASAELFDPKTGTWTTTEAMSSPRFEHTATLLADGKVLMVGGQGPVGGRVGAQASTEIYDPAANAFLKSNDLSEARTNHSQALLPDGSVLVAGGSGGPESDVSIATAELFDPRQGAWTRIAPLGQGRTGHTATVLADGRVLVAGGESASRGQRRSLATAEVYEVATRSWRSAGEMACPRSEQAAVRMADGAVLVVAGDAAFPGQQPIAQSCAGVYRP